MHKEEAYYNNDGEKMFSRSVHFTGRFHDDKGYSLYAYGNTINSRKKTPFPSDMTKTEIANMVLLSRHLALNSNELVYKSKDKYVPMKRKHIGKAIDLEERQAYRFISKMLKLKMIAKVDVPIMGGTEERYLMNPIYFLNGKHIGDFLYWTFQEQLDKEIPIWAREQYRKRKDGEA